MCVCVCVCVCMHVHVYDIVYNKLTVHEVFESRNLKNLNLFQKHICFVIWVHKQCQVRSGQVRSKCLTCTFRASLCSARLSWAQAPAFTGSSVRDSGKNGGGSNGGGNRLHWRVQERTSSLTRIGSRWRVF